MISDDANITFVTKYYKQQARARIDARHQSVGRGLPVLLCVLQQQQLIPGWDG